MKCPTCNDEGFVDRPDNIVETHVRLFGGDIVTHTTNLGGIDACRDCTIRSEVEFLHATQIDHLIRESENDKRSILSNTDSISGTAGNGEARPSAV